MVSLWRWISYVLVMVSATPSERTAAHSSSSLSLSSSSSSSYIADGFWSTSHPNSSEAMTNIKSHMADDPATAAASSYYCGGIHNATHGIIQTPNFPNKFNVPIECIWIIDASSHGDIPIVIYLTQQYALHGLTITEYVYYSSDYKVKSEKSVFEINEEAATQVSWLSFHSPFLEIKFSLDNLYGTHLRALDRLLDVYGFNITYEIGDVKQYQCNALLCRYLGYCYATKDFS